MTDQASQRRLGSVRFGRSKGLLTMAISTVVLVVLGFLLAPSSVSQGAILGMLPFASVLAIIGLGQMLVVQQGGIDLSVPGAVSLAVVLATHIPNENDGLLLPAVLTVYAWAIGAGLRERLHGRSPRPQPDHRHPRNERTAVRCRPRHLGRHPANHHASAQHDRRRPHGRHPERRAVRARDPRARDAPGQEDRRGASLRSRRSEPGRRAGHRPAVPHAPRRGVRLVAAAVRHRRHPARGHHEPAHRLPGQLLPADLGRGRRPRRHVPARAGAASPPPPSSRPSS